jgi:hypothetical protein
MGDSIKPSLRNPWRCLGHLLYSQGKITYPAVRGYLRRLAPTTSPSLIQQAGQIVDEIAKKWRVGTVAQ